MGAAAVTIPSMHFRVDGTVNIDKLLEHNKSVIDTPSLYDIFQVFDPQRKIFCAVLSKGFGSFVFLLLCLTFL